MTTITIHPTKALQGTVRLPPSKSQTMRACLFAALADGLSHVYNPLPSPDTDAMLTACRALGAHIEPCTGGYAIRGVGMRRTLTSHAIDAGNSGIVLRFVGAVLGLFGEQVTITGDASMMARRSCSALIRGLEQLGAKVTSNASHVPLTILGPIRPGRVHIDGADSQPVSGCLIATSLLDGISEIHVQNAGEKSWIALTMHWLQQQGVTIEHDAYSTFRVHGKKHFMPFHYRVHGDMSSLAYFLVAALLLPTDVCIEDVDLADGQPDAVFLLILQKMGASFTIDHEAKKLFVKGPQRLCGAHIDINDCIDMITIVAVVGCFATGKTHITGARIARDKESDRLHAITQELTKMGANIEESEDGLIITSTELHGADLSSHGDHRIALALSVAALCAQGPSTLTDIACIQKSFPDFFGSLAQLL